MHYVPFHALQCAYYLCDWVVSFFFARCCCDVACDGETSFPTSMPSICPARTEVILHSGRVLIVASLRPAVRTKKRLPNKQCSKFRGTRNLEHRCFCRRKNIRVDNFTNVFGWRRRTSSILNRSCGYRPT